MRYPGQPNLMVKIEVYRPHRRHWWSWRKCVDRWLNQLLAKINAPRGMDVVHRYHLDARDSAKVPMGHVADGGVIGGEGQGRYVLWGYEFKPSISERPDLRDSTL